MPEDQDRGIQGKTEMFPGGSWKFQTRGGDWGETKEDIPDPGPAQAN
jgi:hypothetical protein